MYFFGSGSTVGITRMGGGNGNDEEAFGGYSMGGGNGLTSGGDAQGIEIKHNWS